MISLIAGTNNQKSFTEKVARLYLNRMEQQQAHALYFSLTELNGLVLDEQMYDTPPEIIENLSQKYFAPSDKLLFIVPEYNGSIPGVIKLLFDAMDVKKYLYGKKAAIVGVATGRAGNLRGIDHLTSILQHMKITVMPHILPFSSVHLELADNLQLQNPKTSQALDAHIQNFLKF